MSISEFTRLSKELAKGLKEISQQIDHLQDQIDSLAAVVLQNRCGLDLATVAQGGLCALLEEYCCFFTNKLGLV
jgi:excinuclease UvrABC helicase subunit UvrB